MVISAPTRTGPALPESGTVEHVLSHCPATTIAVGGTSGKSSTSALLADALRESGFRVAFGLRPVLANCRELTADDRVVLEVPPAGGAAVRGVSVLALTSLAADELGAGESVNAAIRGLRQAVARARHAVIAPADSEQLVALADVARAHVWLVSRCDPAARISVVNGALVARNGRQHDPIVICRLSPGILASPALTTNVLVGAGAALAAGATPMGIAGAVRRIAAQSDCQELVAIRSGVRWVSDARATRPGRAAAAMAGSTTPVLLIAGGSYGGQPLDLWCERAAAAAYVLLFGTGGSAMADALRFRAGNATLVRCADLDDAVLAAARLARRGDTVLFSPGCEPSPEAAIPPAERFRELASMPRSARAEAA